MGRLCFWRDWEERPDKEVGVQGGEGLREDTQSFAQAGLEACVSIHKQCSAQGGACGCGPREEADRRQLGVCSQGPHATCFHRGSLT